MTSTENHPVLLFDGLCNLCNGAVQWIIQRDQEGVFRYASLQSEFGQRLQRENGLDPNALDSIILYEDGEVMTKSEAVVGIAQKLGWPYRIGVMGKILPTFVRDGLYDWVARNRYRWFGKKDECMLPRPEWRGRFLD